MLRDEYIYQEMLEQERIVSLQRTLPPPEWPVPSERVFLTGSGDSYCAALFGQWVMKERGQVFGLPPLEASQAAKHFQPGDTLTGISVSGRTARVLEAAKRALAAGAQVVAVTDDLQSPLAELASSVWPIYASPPEELGDTDYTDQHAKQYIGYHHDVAQTKTLWAALLTLIRAAEIEPDWQVLFDHTCTLLSHTFYEPLFNTAKFWAESGQIFFLGSGWAKIVARFASYKMHEFNRLALFTGIEEYCHTLYFITRSNDTIVFLVFDEDTAARAREVVPVLCEFFDARIIWLQPESFGNNFIPAGSEYSIQVLNTPASNQPLQQFLDFILAVQWLTYAIGRVNAPNINTFHAGYDTERLVAGTLRTIRNSAIRSPKPKNLADGD
jgi:DNA-binding MurR/RpiR family transcriptional regulator